MAYIELENIDFSYDLPDGEKKEVLCGVSMKVEKGELVAVLGRNGSGKSTIAKIIDMIVCPDSGKLVIDGTDVTGTDDESVILNVRKKIGMVFQNPDNQIFATIVEEDVAFGPENLGIESGEIRRRVDEALAEVGMTEYARHAPHNLSGGQKQRVAIAGVLAMKPECIIFDESTAMLDPQGREDVMDIIRRLRYEEGKTVIEITHNMSEVIEADRVIVLDGKKVGFTGTPAELFSDEERICSLGLEMPQSVELYMKLASLGLPLAKGKTGMREIAEEIAHALVSVR